MCSHHGYIAWWNTIHFIYEEKYVKIRVSNTCLNLFSKKCTFQENREFTFSFDYACVMNTKFVLLRHFFRTVIYQWRLLEASLHRQISFMTEKQYLLLTFSMRTANLIMVSRATKKRTFFNVEYFKIEL